MPRICPIYAPYMPRRCSVYAPHIQLKAIYNILYLLNYLILKNNNLVYALHMHKAQRG